MSQIFTSLQFFMSLFAYGVIACFPSLVSTLIAVACSQFDKLKAAILYIREQHITSHSGQEVEQVHKISNCDFQAKIYACIRHHQEIME